MTKHPSYRARDQPESGSASQHRKDKIMHKFEKRVTFSEGNSFTLPAKGSCVGLRKSDTELLAQINEILATIDSDARTEMWNTAVANQPK